MTDLLVSNARLMPSGLTLMMDYPHFAQVSSMITAFNFETYKAFASLQAVMPNVSSKSLYFTSW